MLVATTSLGLSPVWQTSSTKPVPTLCLIPPIGWTVDFHMRCAESFSVLWNGTGPTRRQFLCLYLSRHPADHAGILSVRAKIQNADDEYDASNRFFLRGLYAGFRGDLDDVENGFLKSPLTVKVCHSFVFLQPCLSVCIHDSDASLPCRL